MTPDAVLQYGALGLLALVLFGLYKIGSRVADAFIKSLERSAQAFDDIRNRFADHDIEDQGRHDEMKTHISREVDRATRHTLPGLGHPGMPMRD